MERAFQRGRETGRFVQSDYLLRAHQGVSRDMHKALASNVGRAIKYELYDNNVARGEMPVLVESGNL